MRKEFILDLPKTDDKPPGTCHFMDCTNEVRHTALGICFTCYRYLLVWRDRNPEAKRVRKRQINRLGDRLDYMMVGKPMPKKKVKKVKTKTTGNVISIKRKR